MPRRIGAEAAKPSVVSFVHYAIRIVAQGAKGVKSIVGIFWEETAGIVIVLYDKDATKQRKGQIYSMIDQDQKQDTKTENKRRRLPAQGIAAIIIILITALIAFSYIGIHGSFASVQNVFTPPVHFTYSGHTQYVSSVAWSPDGKRIASASGDGTVQVWDSYTGEHVLTYRGHQGDVLSAAWSPNGQEIASGGLDGTVQVWNAATGQPILTYRGHTNAVFAVAWSHDGRYLASASEDGTVQVWNAATGQRLYAYGQQTSTASPSPWNTVAWSPDGTRIAIGGVSGALAFDALTGKNVTVYGAQGAVHDVAWSPGGQYLAIASNSAVQVWNVASKQNVYTFRGDSESAFAVAWSPNGQRIASGSGDGMVSVWDALTGKHLYQYRGHFDLYPGHTTYNAAVNSLAWSPDGTHIASGSSDDTVQVWSAPGGN